MTKISCDTVREILRGEREDDLSADESARFTGHLETCADCGRVLAAAEADLAGLARSARKLELAASPALPSPAMPSWGRVDTKLRETVATFPPGQDEPFAREQIAIPGSSTTRRRAQALPVVDSKREKRPLPLPTVVKAPPPAPSVPLRYRLFGSGRARRGNGAFVLAAAAASFLFGWFLLREMPEPKGSPAGDTADRSKPLKKHVLLDKNGKPIGYFIDASGAEKNK